MWAHTIAPIGGTTLAAGPALASVDLLSAAETATGARLEDATVMAIRGTLFASMGVAPCQAKWGIKVMSRALFASGMVIANSGPLTNPNEDWMWKATWWSPTGTPAYPNANRNVMLDIKSRRKLRNLDDTLVLLGESPATATASSLCYDISVLLALP